MGVGDREKSFKGLNNGGMKKFRAADMVPANATKEKKSDFKETFTCRSLRWVETDGMIGLLIIFSVLLPRTLKMYRIELTRIGISSITDRQANLSEDSGLQFLNVCVNNQVFNG
ncbi:hypothetical protein J1N35_003058 [Gossypium stocksii]|uniref:Uncharacterized protein n=1 Tax=Gossypium stocksii TaxID=47602 RepID=A0A9D3WMC0_9ROSI|nr:hypothetical protein J1N35_003058 [Gossypium stocksii]